MPFRIRSEWGGPGLLGEIRFKLLDNTPLSETINQVGRPVFSRYGTCIDVVGEHFLASGAEKDHEFLIERLIGDEVPSLSGSTHDSDIITEVHGWVPEFYREFTDWYRDSALVNPNNSNDPITDYDSFSEWLALDFPPWLEHLDLSEQLVPVNVLLSRTNPGVPELDIPSEGWETLAGLPDLIKLRGETILGLVGSANLSWEFGWKPLLGDLEDLLNFGEIVSKRLKTIQKLIKGLYKSKKWIERQSNQSEGIFPLMAGLDSLDNPVPQVNVRRETKLERWGSVSYRLTAAAEEEFKRYSLRDQEWLAKKAAFGLTLSNPSSYWEVTPWSWLVDWFLPIQDLLDTYQNVIPVDIAAVNVMTRRTTLVTFLETDHPWLVANPRFTIKRETLERRVLAPDGTLPQIAAGRPILDARKLGLLASIRAGRFKKDKLL